MKISLTIVGMTELYGGKFAGVLDAVKRADTIGIDQVALGEHLAMLPDSKDAYPLGAAWAQPVDFPRPEPMAVLSAIAAVTRSIRLSTNVLISPLRPTLLLAKQIATLDLISNGRVEMAFGAGWHRDEFEAAEMPFDGRFSYMEEQIRACRVLWGPAPANFQGKRTRFTNLHMHPQPPQGPRLPIWLGVDATPRGIERIVELADGWAAPPEGLDKIAPGIVKVRAALAARGRDPDHFPVRATLRPVKRADGRTDWDASFAQAVAHRDAGATMLGVNAYAYCRSADEVAPFLERLIALRNSL